MNLYGNTEESNFYHVMVRGIGKQIIFEESKDNQHFINLLQYYSKDNNVVIVCYCLMNNHVHLLCQDNSNNIPELMQNLCSRYAKYFNKKYDRVGSLFQGPYLKKNIKNSSHLLQVFHYIIRNPEKDKICKYSKYE